MKSRLHRTNGLGRTPVALVVGIFFVSSALPLILLTYLSISLGEKGLRDEVRHHIDGVAVASAESLDKETQALGDVTEAFATRTEIREALIHPSAQNASALGPELDQLIGSRDGISVTFITDARGRLVAGRPDNPANVGQDFSFRDWYKGVTATNATYVSNAFTSAAPGAPLVVAIATPVRDTGGRIIGFIGANYGLKAIQSFVGRFAGSQGVDITVTDRQGNVLASPQAQTPRLTSLRNDPRVNAALRGSHGVRTWTRDGTHLVSAYAPASNIGWAVIADTPAKTAFAPVSKLRTAVLASAGALGLVLVAGLVFLALTIRHRARIGEQLEQSEQETRSILEASADAYIAMDEEGRIRSWSGQAEHTFGWTAGETIGKYVADLIIPPEFRDAHWTGLRRYLETGAGNIIGKRIELRGLHKDGREFPIEMVIWAVRSGEKTVFSAFCHDITERQKAAAELAAARDRAVELSRLKSEFVANMSHEIRTPMNGVVGMVDLLYRTDLTSEQREYTETVRRSAEALLYVINDILDFSKIEAGRMELDSVQFDLAVVIEEAGELLAGAAQTKGLELTTSIDQDVPVTVTGDPGRLRQVLLNLLGNAVKFTDEGEVTIRCSVERADDAAHTCVRFEISDTGCGIQEEDRPRLFESFSQLDPSLTRRHGGTGLGLVISKRLVELMHGEIGVESTPGLGSTFWFTVEFAVSRSDGARTLPVPNSIAGIRVLVVDDNATNREVLSKMLSSWKLDTSTSPNAKAAFDLLKSETNSGRPFSIVILDSNMPGMGGADLARLIADDSSLRSVKRLLLTSSGELGRARGSRDSQNDVIDAYLSKPVRQSSLLNTILELLDRDGRLTRRTERSAPVAQTTKQRILVAEDNAVNQIVTREMLNKMGYEVDIASNGREAVDAALRVPYAAVLMDCQMPVMDGYEATAELRRREGRTRHTVVIALTAHAMQGDAEKCLQAGMEDYLSKPVSWEDLGSVLQRWIGEVTPTSQSHSPTSTGHMTTLDISTLEKIVDTTNDPESRSSLMRNLVEAFVETGKTQLVGLRTAIGNDPEEVRSFAHKLKGGSATLGATRLASLCQELETLAADRQTERFHELWMQISDEFKSVCGALQAEVGQ